jgi:peptidoglycan/xylan/chitin deacetylase (PgdA/CDA1 family)
MPAKINLFPYSLKIAVNVFVMTFIVAYLTFFLLENFAAQNSIFVTKQPKSDIFLLDSAHSRKTLDDWGLDKNHYQTQLNGFAARFSGSPYRVKQISESQLATLPSDSVLLVIDAVSLSTDNLRDIEAYVAKGGSLMLNHMAGFNDPNGNYRGGEFVDSITGLKHQKPIGEQLAFKGLFVTPKIFSPLTEYVPDGDRLSLVIYEPLPIFNNNGRQPDLILTNWARNQPPNSYNKQPIPLQSAGAMWHGLKGEGRWVYFNFPGYVFNERGSQADSFDDLFKGAVDYLRLPSQLRLMPYLNKESATVVFEDVEYQYETLNQFIDIAEKYQLPMTTFQVAEEAKKKKEILQRSHQSSYIEVGSHSYSHGKIIKQSEQILEKEIADSKSYLEKNGKAVVGFRPPREELDDAMLEQMIDAEYDYVLAGNQDKIYPQLLANDFVVIPRLGTDDYGFFVTGQISVDKIQSQVISEAAMLKSINAVYTLGVHTHLMTYGDNLKIFEEIVKKLKATKNHNIMTAAEVAKRVRQAKNIEHYVNTTTNNHIINVTNNNHVEVKNVILRLYWQGSLPIQSIKSEVIGVKVTAEHNREAKYSDIHIESLKANANLSILARYKD